MTRAPYLCLLVSSFAMPQPVHGLFFTCPFFLLPVPFLRMSVTPKEVKDLADLARLELGEVELAKSEHELEAVLKYVDRLTKIDTTGVEPQAMPAQAAGWRVDVAVEGDDVTRELVLSNFPSRKQNLLHVPAVFENPKA